ncbi:MAG TPA: aminotransferase class I/II-fold pyridoxal phosphate-dependent enzyme [Modicisalibacter sp.]|nr:aminotransferase class I/II-fold pyridoxal phosphate-dependent enzyme [Modicisalibacter sp.]
MRSFTQQEPIPEAAIARAVEVMRSGRLHRYNTAKDEVSETALLEQEFAAYLGVRYCLACASGGYAMAVALRAFGLEAGEVVATNAFTLSPVPGAIHAAGGRPVLVESTENLVLDLDDLECKLKDNGARILLLSHMRGHLVDMDALTEILNRYGVALIEDCAHTMGAAWKGRPSGTFGTASCFSTQTYKHLNSGEGGFVTTDNPELMARAVILSGSYMFYDRHLAGPDDSVYTDIRLDTPNCSGRMDNLRAALLRPQLTRLDENVRRWNARYRAIEQELSGVKGLHLPRRLPEETFVGSSFQFRVPSLSPRKAEGFVAVCRTHGVELKWFGATEPVGYTSQHHSWRYSEPQIMPQTDHILQGLFDMRIPLTFSVEDCRLIGRIIRTNLETVVANNS